MAHLFREQLVHQKGIIVHAKLAALSAGTGGIRRMFLVCGIALLVLTTLLLRFPVSLILRRRA